MSAELTIKINFRGGIISPGVLYNILVAAKRSGCRQVSFGLRQQLYVPVSSLLIAQLEQELTKLGIAFETDTDEFPCIMSSYPAEEIFIHNTWVSEGVYKDIFDEFNYTPKLKLNLSDSNQSFTPLLTGNINWVASASSPHFWHLFVRLPKTNHVYQWDRLTYTNDVARLSQLLEALILEAGNNYSESNQTLFASLMNQINLNKFITRETENPAMLPAFNLPYYEGLNRYNDKYWLGVYRRDELFDIEFLQDLCSLCLETRIGQICSTPWKSIIVKSIEEKDRARWNYLLEKHQINMRHAANELNFQVEDHCSNGLALKQYLVRQLNNDDTRSFGICIGIKTRRKSEVFSSILVVRKPLFSFLGMNFLHVYDILCAHDFNPNERTAFVFSRNNPRFVLREQLRRAILLYYHSKADKQSKREVIAAVREKKETPKQKDELFYCPHCFTEYNPSTGDPDQGIPANTSFENLPESYTCSLCEAPKEDFVSVKSEMMISVPA
ncbi:rubredoxin [Pollutibacter soli]|uniref:rubredoxin n=1 Tax=Pollutibacter soli TaxID=3034157 RepID=UPI0030140896